jgi:hypothetical protein
MANYSAISNGNFSNLTIWEDDSLGYFSPSSVLPGSSDNVYSNNFIITIDGIVTVSTIRNTAFIPPTNLALMSIPQMSSNTTPSGAAAASSATSVSGNGASWSAFDRNTSTWWQSGNAAGQWLSYQFPIGKIIKRYGFFTSTNALYNPRTWTFEGSNNGSTWVVLDTQTAFVSGVSTFYSFDISANTTSYTYYRINVSAVSAGGTNPVIIAELEMSEVTNLYGGIVAGGQFKFSNGGNLTCSASNAIEVGSTTPTLLYDLSSGNTATFNGNVISLAAITGGQSIRYSSNGTFNIVGNFTLNNAANTSRRIFDVTGTGIINHIGDINSSQTQNVTQPFTVWVSSNCVYNHTGNCTGGATGQISGVGVGIFTSSPFTYNQTGNQIAGTAPSFFTTAGSTLNITGNVNGVGNFPAIFNQTSPATIDILGTTTSGVGAPAIQGLATTFVILRGNIVNTDTYCAIYAGRVVINDNVTSWQFKDSTNTITRTLYTAGVNLGNPATNNVRNGVTYGPSLELTGTMFVPSPINTRIGVPVDNTVGTGQLTAEDFLQAIENSTSGVGLRLKNVATVQSVGNQLQTYSV